MVSANWFVNAAGMVRTSLAPMELLGLLLVLEEGFGRQRNREERGHRDRTLDLDLLLYGNQVLAGPQLELPHPELHRRLFVLMPLCEIAPELRHPVLGQSTRQLLVEQLTGNSPACLKSAWPEGMP